MSSLDQAMACHQANIWTNDGLLSIVQLGKHFNDKVNQTTKLFIKEVDSYGSAEGPCEVFKKVFVSPN